MEYSILYKDAKGITSRSEFLPFASDPEAISHGQGGASGVGAVEIWKGDDLLVRLASDDRAPHVT